MRSCRFHRKWGSDRFLRIRIEQETSRNIENPERQAAVRRILERPLEVLGRVYWSYWHEETDGYKTVYLFATEDLVDVMPPPWPPLEKRTLLDFVSSHIDLLLSSNRELAFAKFVSRFKLGLSNTVRNSFPSPSRTVLDDGENGVRLRVFPSSQIRLLLYPICTPILYESHTQQ